MCQFLLQESWPFAPEQQRQCFTRLDVILLAVPQVGAGQAEGTGAVFRAQAAGHFLLDIDHADVPLALMAPPDRT